MSAPTTDEVKSKVDHWKTALGPIVRRAAVVGANNLRRKCAPHIGALQDHISGQPEAEPHLYALVALLTEEEDE